MDCMVIKVIELIGTSDDGFEAAIQEAVARSSKTVKNITGMDILGQSVRIKENTVEEYRVHLKVAFRVEN